jgi:hypothetical protein
MNLRWGFFLSSPAKILYFVNPASCCTENPDCVIFPYKFFEQPLPIDLVSQHRWQLTHWDDLLQYLLQVPVIIHLSLGNALGKIPLEKYLKKRS